MQYQLGKKLLENSEISEIENKSGTSSILKVQSNSATLTYTVKGKIDDDLDYIECTGVDATLATVTAVNSKSIVSYDVTGLSHITITVSGTPASTDIVFARLYSE